MADTMADRVTVSVEPKEKIKTVVMFRTRLRSIEHRLYNNGLKPHIDMIREHNGRRLNVKLTPLYDLVAAWEHILIKSEPIRKWQVRDKLKLSNDLKELDDKIVAILQMKDEILKEPVYIYDVFLCFRGKDTRESFTSTLSSCLKSRKVNIFMDDNFKKGCNLDHLLKMIEISRISIVVFSENFAESKWCLNELEKIFQERDQRGLEVVPVFYNVELEELKHQSGKTKKHMKKHHKEYGRNSDIINSWSNAISVLGNSAGFTYESGKGMTEAKRAEEIAEEISNRLNDRKSNKGRPPLWSANKKKKFRHNHGFKLSVMFESY